MSYKAYPMKLEGGKWVKTCKAGYSLACVATVPNAVQRFEERGTAGTGILYDMSDINKPEYIELANFLAETICSAHKHWFTHPDGLRSPIFIYDQHTYDDIFYAVSPFRQIIEYPTVMHKFLSVYPIERLRTLTPRQVKRLWFTMNRVSFTVGGEISMGGRGNNHSAFTLLHYDGDGSWRIKARAASQLINSDTHWRSRVGYPEGKKPKPFNKAGDTWTVATRDVSQCPTYASSAKQKKIDQLYNQDAGEKSLVIHHKIGKSLSSTVRHCFKVYDEVIQKAAIKPPSSMVFPIEAFANTCKRRAA